MKEIYYVYNNEAIASCIFLSVLNNIDKLEITRSCLVLPFLLDDRTVNYLSKNKDAQLEDMIREQSRLFTSFNKRYLSLLPVAINSLTILNASNQISIGNEIVAKASTLLVPKDKVLGDRFNKIQEVIPMFLSMIEKHTTVQLYKILKVQL